jgi:uncharacterized protein DUF3108
MSFRHLISFLSILLLACSQDVAGVGPPGLRADRLQMGIFIYRETLSGKEQGIGEIRIRRLSPSGNFQFSNIEGGVFAQSWDAVAAADFSPVSASLTFGSGADARPAFELHYHEARVTGVVYPGKVREAAGPRKVDDAVAADTVDQRIDWAAAMAFAEYLPGHKFEFHVYDPGTGNSRDVVRIGAEETIVVPAGSFQTVHVTYTIEKNRGAETYEVWVSKQSPRFLVREKFPDGSVSELLRWKPF